MLIGRRPKTTLLRILLLLALCGFTFKFILLPIQVDGISMEPTYHDRHVNCVNLLAYHWHEPQRGDVVTIRRSRRTVRLLHLKDSSFLEALRRKLQWRGTYF